MKAFLKVLFAVLTAAGLTALFTCSQTSPVTDNSPSGITDYTNIIVSNNNAPTAGFSASIEVTEASEPNINGIYVCSDTNIDGSLIYTNANGFFIYNRTPDGSYCVTYRYWHISTNSSDYGYYKINGVINSEVPNAKWGKTCNSGTSTPYTRIMNQIKGYPYVGQVLTAPAHTYHDDESDPEGISYYSWYRCDTNTNDTGTLISGATGTSYTLTAADEGKYIYFAVTPRASSGTTAGSNATSAYFGPIQTIPSAYVVSGAGDGTCNGIYTFNGFFNGLPYFKHQTADMYLYSGGCNGYWQLQSVFEGYGNYYRCNIDTKSLYFTNESWFTGCDGTDPTPSFSITNL